jgi:ABC-type branched-subunit amino acid transport system substrate-binding protein
MARPSFRASAVGAALALAGSIALITGCTPPEAPPQAVQPPPPVAMAAPPPPPPEAAAVPAQPVSPVDGVTAGHVKVALLAPLSGPNKSVGQAMLDAADLALFDVNADVALLPRDTGSSADGARAAAQKALADGAVLVLGPVFATSVAPVREVTDSTPVSVIAYTTDANAAGGSAFVMGFLPAFQVERVVGFAKSRGMTKIAALVPDNAYGVAVTAALNRMSAKLGIPAPRILVVARDVKGQIASLADDPPQALLIALGGDQLQGLAPALGDLAAAHPLQLLGTGLWDDPALAELPALAGGWYAAPAPENFTNFAGRFQQVYNYRPPRIATLAYDSVALAAAVSKGAADLAAPIGRDLLLQPNGFTGIDGAFRFLPSGLSERNLAVLQVGPGGATVIDPAPPNFEPLGQ